MAVLAQQLDDHLTDCVRERQSTNRRLGRIEALVWVVGGSIILQLISALAFFAIRTLDRVDPVHAAAAAMSQPLERHDSGARR